MMCNKRAGCNRTIQKQLFNTNQPNRIFIACAFTVFFFCIVALFYFVPCTLYTSLVFFFLADDDDDDFLYSMLINCVFFFFFAVCVCVWVHSIVQFWLLYTMKVVQNVKLIRNAFQIFRWVVALLLNVQSAKTLFTYDTYSGKNKWIRILSSGWRSVRTFRGFILFFVE